MHRGLEGCWWEHLLDEDVADGIVSRAGIIIGSKAERLRALEADEMSSHHHTNSSRHHMHDAGEYHDHKVFHIRVNMFNMFNMFNMVNMFNV